MSGFELEGWHDALECSEEILRSACIFCTIISTYISSPIIRVSVKGIPLRLTLSQPHTNTLREVKTVVLANYMYMALTMTMLRSSKATGKVLDGRVGNRIQPRRREVWYAQV
jgi:hypothetical protein